MNLESGGVVRCAVCRDENSNAAYTCPRCNVRYCRVQCYQSHSAHCTEAFAREHVLALSKSFAQTPAAQRATAQILQREHAAHADTDFSTFHADGDEDDADDNDDDDDDERFRLALDRISQGDVAGGLAQLTAAQRAEFDGALRDGSLARLVQLWSPWWVQVDVPPSRSVADACTGSLIVDLSNTAAGGDDDEHGAASSALPALPDSVPALDTLTKVPPSPLIANNLIDILFAYVLVKRLYNGDTSAEPREAALFAVRCSTVLSERAVHETSALAIDRCMARCRTPQFLQPMPVILGAVRDVCGVLRCRRFVSAALADLSRLIQSALALVDSLTEKRVSSLLLAALNKVRYFSSWLLQFEIDRLAELEQCVRAIADDRVALVAQRTDAVDADAAVASALPPPAAATTKPKIEEIR